MLRGIFLHLVGIWRQLRIALTPNNQRRKLEAHFWGAQGHAHARQTSWDSIECLGRMAVSEMTGGRWEQLMDVIVNTISLPDLNHLHGLVLGCGDMVGERWYFIHPALPFDCVDAYDISAEAIQRAKQLTDSLGLNVRYHVQDVNQIHLLPNTYDLVVVAHSMHHFKRIEHIVDQVNQSLKPGGLFVAWEYVGPRFQQFTRRQIAHANMILRALPPKYRRELDGSMRTHIKSQSLLLISPDEAIRSDLILPTIQRRMNVLYQYNWAGLLFSLLRGGIAANFDQNDLEDRKIINCLFQLDRLLCQSGQVGPNFTITIAAQGTDELVS